MIIICFNFFLERVVICLPFFLVSFLLWILTCCKRRMQRAGRLPCFPLSFYLLCQLTIINSTFHIYSVVHILSKKERKKLCIDICKRKKLCIDICMFPKACLKSKKKGLFDDVWNLNIQTFAKDNWILVVVNLVS